jgi:hypothetical protein
LKVEVDYLNPFINVPVSKNISADEIGRHAHELPQLVGSGVAQGAGLSDRNQSAAAQGGTGQGLSPQGALSGHGAVRARPDGACSGAPIVYKNNRIASARLAQVQSRVSALESVEVPLRQTESEIRALNEKADRYRDVAEKRVAWLEILAEIQAVLPADVFLTSVTAIRVPSPDPNAPPAMPGGPQPGSIIGFEVSGGGYKDKVVSPTPIIGLRDALRQSPWFSETSDFQRLSTPTSDQYIREFKLNLMLKKPLST